MLNKRSTSVKKFSVSQQSVRTFFDEGGNGECFGIDNDADMEESESYEELLDEATHDEVIDSEGDGSPDPQAVSGGDELSMDPLMVGLLVVGGLVIFGFFGFCCVMAVLSAGTETEAKEDTEDGRQERYEEERKNKERVKNQWIIVV